MTRRLRMLFVHHSCGGQLLAAPGPACGDHCIFTTHPNGGELRSLLRRAGFEVGEASYGSAIGDKTDLFDWWPKFRDCMDDVLACAHQDERLPPGERNAIVAFKSCFPNSAFVGEGKQPGDPCGPELTLSNARATMDALLGELAKRPEVLFVYVTAPPLAPRRRMAAWERLLRKMAGRLPPNPEASGALARRFNDWLRSPDGWLRGYAGRNVVVFDYFDVLTGGGPGNVCTYPTRGGTDSHPSREGNARAASAFVETLQSAVRRAGLNAASRPEEEMTHAGRT